MNTFDSIKNRIKKHWTLIWLICSVLGVGVFVVFASYTGVNSVKRVVSTKSSSSVLFSSNSLKSSATSQRLSSTDYTITVCNYAQDNTSEVNISDITYTLNAYLAIKAGDKYVKLSDYTGEDKQNYVNKLKVGTDEQRTYSIQMIKDDSSTYTGEIINLVTQNDYSVSISDNYTKLSRSKSSTDQFKIILDSKELEGTEPEFYIYVEAVPTSPSALSTIYNRLCTAQSTADVASWIGTLIDEDCSTVDHDFYNYVLTGSGVGTVDVLWNPEKFEINEFFFSEMSGNEFVLYNGDGEVTEDTSTGLKVKNVTGDESHSGWKMATLKVDSTKINRYQIQLYKVIGSLSYTGDNKASDFIDCEYHKSVSTNS